MITKEPIKAEPRFDTLDDRVSAAQRTVWEAIWEYGEWTKAWQEDRNARFDYAAQRQRLTDAVAAYDALFPDLSDLAALTERERYSAYQAFVGLLGVARQGVASGLSTGPLTMIVDAMYTTMVSLQGLIRAAYRREVQA